MALVTLAAIGSWYWWRRPFEVEHTGLNRSAIVREVETVRRLWGGKTIRVGPVVGYDEDGRKIAESYYREGVLHGPSVTWFRDGHIREQGEYVAGKKEGPWVRYSQHVEREPPRIVLAKTVAAWKSGVPDGRWEWFDSQGQSLYTVRFANGRLIGPPPAAFERGLGQCLVDGRIDDPKLQLALLSPSELEFVECPLKDAIDFISEKHEVPMRLDARRLEESGVNIDAPVTLRIEEGPLLIECLARILEPLRLVGDYRYGLLTITTPQGTAASDTSGVSQIEIPPDSPLASVWNRRVTLELVETPLTAALGLMEKQVGIEGLFVFEDTPTSLQHIPMTMRIQNHPFSLALGLLLEDVGRARLKDEGTIAISLDSRNQAVLQLPAPK